MRGVVWMLLLVACKGGSSTPPGLADAGPDASPDAKPPVCTERRVRSVPLVACPTATFPGRIPSEDETGNDSNYSHFVTGDLNGDGRLDVVTSSSNAPLDVFLNSAASQTQGVFPSPNPQGVASYWDDLALGDLDGNGTLDLVTTSRAFGGGNPVLAVMLGAGNGTFSPAVTVSAESGRIALGDVDADGKLDIVRAGFDSVAVMRNLGNLTFAAPVVHATPDGTKHVVLADLDGDTRLDIVVLGSEVTIFAGGPSGFGPAQSYPAAGRAIRTADLDGDGVREIIVVGSGSSNTGTMSVLTRSPTGYTTTVRSLPYRAYDVAIGDLDQDGDPDVVVTADDRGAMILINASGVLGSPTRFDTGQYESDARLALFDLDGDAKLDVLLNGRFLNWYRGTGTGTFTSSSLLPDTETLLHLQDLDGDGRAELVFWGAGRFRVVRDNGDGSYSTDDYPIEIGNPDLTVADLDDDGILDIAFVTYRPRDSRGQLRIFFGAGGATFQWPVIYNTTSPGIPMVVAADVNGDCLLDLVVGGGGFRDPSHMIYDPGATDVLLNLGDRTFGQAARVGAEASTVLVGDLDNDGYPELVTEAIAGTFVARGLGNAQFAAGTPLAEVGLAGLADVDHDGKLDLLAAAGVRLGLGDRTFAPPAGSALRGTPLGDIDGDGEIDFKETQHTLAFGNGDGTAKRRIHLRQIGDFAGDLNRDGLVDLAFGPDGSSGDLGGMLFQECR